MQSLCLLGVAIHASGGVIAAGFHVHPHQLRHSHAMQAIRRGVDVFTLQVTLGHSSSATTGHYVAANPRESSSLRLA